MKIITTSLPSSSILLCKFFALCTKYTVESVGTFKPPLLSSDINSQGTSSSSLTFVSPYLWTKYPAINTTFYFTMSEDSNRSWVSAISNSWTMSISSWSKSFSQIVQDASVWLLFWRIACSSDVYYIYHRQLKKGPPG